jgi:hypothetical protein
MMAKSDLSWPAKLNIRNLEIVLIRKTYSFL